VAAPVVLAVALTGALAAGCSSGDVGDPGALGTAAPNVSLSPNTKPPTINVPGLGNVDLGDVDTNAALPANFPLPPGAKVTHQARVGSTITATLSGVTAEQAAAYYRTALPAAGYKITTDRSSSGTLVMIFSGSADSGTIASDGGTVAIILNGH
jgi:hypothetical protein